MAQLNGQNQTTELEDDFDGVPTGSYITVISASDYVVNSKNTGMNLKLTYEIIDGEFKGKKLFESLSLEHEKADTAIIANKAWNSIKMATVQKLHVEDSCEVHGIPLLIEVIYKKDSDFPNKIKKHLPVNGGASAPAQTGFQKPAAQGSEAPKKSQPWQK